MIRLTVDSQRPHYEAIETAVRALDSGGVVALPTDTLYGLSVDPRNDRAVRRVFAIKGRASGLALPLVAADEAQIAETLGPLGETAQVLARRFWPGPLAIVIPSPTTIVSKVTAGRGTIAVRVPAHEVPRALCRAFGWPLTATSANRSGEPPPMSATEVASALDSDVEVLLDAGLTPGGPPSTIVSTTDGEVRLVRPGAIAWKTIERCLYQ